MNKFTRFVTSKIGLLFLGFVLTTFCGGIINEWHGWTTWKRDKKFELLTRKLGKHEELLSSLSTVVGARVYRMQRVLWALEAPSPRPPGDAWQLDEAVKKRINDRWDEYYLTVIDWNLNYRNYTTRIRFFAGSEVADKFFVGDVNGARKAKSGTVCGSFERAHDLVKELKDMTLNSAGVDRTKQYDLAQGAVDHLYNTVDAFVAELYSALDKNANSDNPLLSSDTGN